MKIFQSKYCAALIVMVSGLCFVSSSPADESADAERRSQYYDLLDQEKQLIKTDDDLSRAIFDLKQAINELHKKLDLAQETRDTVRHHLITVRMKLMP
jgi:hypothetical protein